LLNGATSLVFVAAFHTAIDALYSSLRSAVKNLAAHLTGNGNLRDLGFVKADKSLRSTESVSVRAFFRERLTTTTSAYRRLFGGVFPVGLSYCGNAPIATRNRAVQLGSVALAEIESATVSTPACFNGMCLVLRQRLHAAGARAVFVAPARIAVELRSAVQTVANQVRTSSLEVGHLFYPILRVVLSCTYWRGPYRRAVRILRESVVSLAWPDYIVQAGFCEGGAAQR
jgi:hypothetical protein